MGLAACGEEVLSPLSLTMSVPVCPGKLRWFGQLTASCRTPAMHPQLAILPSEDDIPLGAFLPLWSPQGSMSMASFCSESEALIFGGTEVQPLACTISLGCLHGELEGLIDIQPASQVTPALGSFSEGAASSEPGTCIVRTSPGTLSLSRALALGWPAAPDILECPICFSTTTQDSSQSCALHLQEAALAGATSSPAVP